MDNINFKELKYNLYELLNVNNNASSSEISKNYKKIIKNFHPDKTKITALEEELYYAIVQAYSILMDDKNRKNYNMFLSINNSSRNKSSHNFQYENISQYYVPDNKQDAMKMFTKQSQDLYNRHGGVDVKEKLSKVYKKTIAERENLPDIVKERFNDMDDFNNTFINRKKGGIYSDKIVEYKGGAITAYEGNSSLNLTSLKDFHNMYSEDTVANGRFASKSIAYNLMPHIDVEEKEEFDYDTTVNSYNQVSQEINDNFKNGQYNNYDFLNNF